MTSIAYIQGPLEANHSAESSLDSVRVMVNLPEAEFRFFPDWQRTTSMLINAGADHRPEL